MMIDRTLHRLFLYAVIATIFVALPASQVSAQVPEKVPFQGLLLDDVGDPVNASVDLEFELFDDLVVGSALWTELHPGVIVVDGVYSVELGSTTPLTSGVVGSGSVFLEITVDGETMTPRQQFLSAPYAIVAGDTNTVGGVSSAFVAQAFEYFAFDGQDPPNNDPSEGLADVDGDGMANFIDPDNDDDGITDGDELANGSSINDVTPTIATVTPSPIQSYTPTSLLVSGTSLDLSPSVAFAGESPVPYAVTPTSFSIDVQTESNATTEVLTVTLGNGESAQSTPLAITAVAPTITDAPAYLEAGIGHSFDIDGIGFYDGTIVHVGSQTVVPSALSETQLSVMIGPEPEGTTTIEIEHPNGLVAQAPLVIVPAGAQPRTVFLSSQTNGAFGGIAGGDAICASDASAASLTGSYKAWLSDGASSPSTRLDQSQGPYVLPGGAIAAYSWADLTDGTLNAQINVLANGTSGVNSLVFTGTSADGTDDGGGAAANCAAWTDVGGSARIGSSATTNANWSAFSNSLVCGSSLRIYCFED